MQSFNVIIQNTHIILVNKWGYRKRVPIISKQKHRIGGFRKLNLSEEQLIMDDCAIGIKFMQKIEKTTGTGFLLV